MALCGELCVYGGISLQPIVQGLCGSRLPLRLSFSFPFLLFENSALEFVPAAVRCRSAERLWSNKALARPVKLETCLRRSSKLVNENGAVQTGRQSWGDCPKSFIGVNSHRSSSDRQNRRNAIGRRRSGEIAY